MYKHNINSVRLRPLYHQYVSGEGSENDVMLIKQQQTIIWGVFLGGGRKWQLIDN